VTPPDGVARDRHGIPLSAGELCQRDGCWHRWIDHDHAYAPLFDLGFDRCLFCGCPQFATGSVPVSAPPTVQEAAERLDAVAVAAEATARHALRERP
jgi:hypothetical protein